MQTLAILGFLCLCALSVNAINMHKVLMKQPFQVLETIMPQFLSGLSPQAKTEFEAIVSDQTLTIAQIEAKLHEWAAKQGPATKAKLDHFGKGLKDLIQQALTRVKSSSLSPEAKDAINQMAAVVKNKGQTVPQAKAAMKVVMSKTPKHVTAEINKYMQAHEQEALDKILKLQN